MLTNTFVCYCQAGDSSFMLDVDVPGMFFLYDDWSYIGGLHSTHTSYACYILVSCLLQTTYIDHCCTNFSCPCPNFSCPCPNNTSLHVVYMVLVKSLIRNGCYGWQLISHSLLCTSKKQILCTVQYSCRHSEFCCHRYLCTN